MSLVGINKQNAFNFRIDMVTLPWNLVRDVFWVKSPKQQITSQSGSFGVSLEADTGKFHFLMQDLAVNFPVLLEL